MMGQQANISPWWDYQWVKNYDEQAAFPEDKTAHESDFMECDCKDNYPGAQQQI
jgi:hypothetical protein